MRSSSKTAFLPVLFMLLLMPHFLKDFTITSSFSTSFYDPTPFSSPGRKSGWLLAFLLLFLLVSHLSRYLASCIHIFHSSLIRISWIWGICWFYFNWFSLWLLTLITSRVQRLKLAGLLFLAPETTANWVPDSCASFFHFICQVSAWAPTELHQQSVSRQRCSEFLHAHLNW